MFAIIALIAFLISGTLVGILLFNSFATERRNNAEPVSYTHLDVYKRQELCKAFSAFYNSRIFFIEQIALEQPPIYLVQAMNELANALNSALQSLTETDREQLLQYFYERTNVTPRCV